MFVESLHNLAIVFPYFNDLTMIKITELLCLLLACLTSDNFFIVNCVFFTNHS